jgi:hypothetical protein
MKKWIIFAVAVLVLSLVSIWFLYTPASWQEIVNRCTDYDPHWIGMLDCYGLISISEPDNSGYLVENNSIPGSIIAQIKGPSDFVVKGDQIYLIDITAAGGCVNFQPGYCSTFQVDGKTKTISYSDPHQTPRYLIINTKTGDEQFYVQSKDASSSDQAIFQTLSGRENSTTWYQRLLDLL